MRRLARVFSAQMAPVSESGKEIKTEKSDQKTSCMRSSAVRGESDKGSAANTMSIKKGGLQLNVRF